MAAVIEQGDEQAPFDDSRKALTFALNAHQVSVPSPYMNRAMADIAVKRPRRGSKALRLLRELEEQAQAEVARGKRLRPGNWPASALDRTHLAGYILQKFDALDELHRMALTVRLTQPTVACHCGRPCCSGYTPVWRWVRAVDRLCELVKDQAIAIANEGNDLATAMKVGLSTQPELRRHIVRDWGTGASTTLVDLAARYRLTSLTVARHRNWIVEWLDAEEDAAWVEVDQLFDRTGITGPFL